MILGFKTQFVPKILAGTKIHTIRLDVNDRWKPGKKIQFATGVRTKKYQQFHEGLCAQVQLISIWPQTKSIYIHPEYWIEPYELTDQEIETLAKNDGFDSVDDFWEWFQEEGHYKLIHWTDFKGY